MANAYERRDISDESWAKIELLLPGRKGTWGGNARDNRQFSKCSILDFANRCALALFVTELWRLEKYSSTFLSLAR